MGVEHSGPGQGPLSWRPQLRTTRIGTPSRLLPPPPPFLIVQDTKVGGWSTPGSPTDFDLVTAPAVLVRRTERRKNGPTDAGDQAAPQLCSLPALGQDCSPGGCTVLSPVSRSP